MNQIEVRTASHRQMVDITRQVAAAIDGAGEHADPDVARDLISAYEKMVPDIHFAHAEGNSDAHLMTTLLGSSVTVPVEDGRLRLGTWQGIFFVELDGPRSRKVCVSVH